MKIGAEIAHIIDEKGIVMLIAWRLGGLHDDCITVPFLVSPNLVNYFRYLSRILPASSLQINADACEMMTVYLQT